MFNKLTQKPPLVLLPPIEVQISNHPDPAKDLYRIAEITGQNERYNTNQAILTLSVKHYVSLEGVDGATETVKSKTEKDRFFIKQADNYERVDPATGQNVDQYLYDENGNRIIDEQTRKPSINPDFLTAVPEYLLLSSLPFVIDGSDLWLGAIGNIKVEELSMIGLSNAINKYYVARFDANGFLGLDFYKD